MNKVKALIKYNQNSLIVQDNLDLMLENIVKEMNRLILQDVAITIKNGGTKISVIDKLYRAEFWKDNQEELYKSKDKMLDKFFNIYKKDIFTLKSIYPESDFDISTLDYQLRQFDTFITEEIDILKLMKVTESEAKGLVRMAQFGNITDNQGLIDVIEGQLKKPISHLNTRLKTTQSVIYRSNRNKFYSTIKEADKIYIYAGVSDGVTRPFCRKQLGKVKTQTEWRNLPNGQIGDAWTYGGGYNCRHATYLVTKNWTKEEKKQLTEDFKFNI